MGCGQFEDANGDGIADYTSGDYLYFYDTADIKGIYSKGSGLLKIKGRDTPQAYQDALREIGYRASEFEFLKLVRQRAVQLLLCWGLVPNASVVSIGLCWRPDSEEHQRVLLRRTGLQERGQSGSQRQRLPSWQKVARCGTLLI